MKTKYTYALIPFIFSSSLLAADLSTIKSTENTNKKSIWQGFYFGINGGIGGGNNWSNSHIYRSTSDTNSFGTITPGYSGVEARTSESSGASGGVVGGQIGYNYGFSNGIVIGAETDLNWSNIGSNNSYSIPYIYKSIYGSTIFNISSASSYKLNWYGTTRARLGFATGRMLPYITGGLLYGATNSSINSSQIVGFEVFNLLATENSAANKISTGWTVGAGFEYLLLNNLSLKTEYLYTSFSGIRSTESSFSGFRGAYTNDMTGVGITNNGTFGVHQLKFGANYHLSNEELPITNELIIDKALHNNWEGLYGGINTGYSSGSGNSKTSAITHTLSKINPTSAGVSYFVPTSINTIGGASVGGQVGYNLLVGKKAIVGAETDFQWSGIQSTISSKFVNSTSSNILNNIGYENLAYQMQWLGTSRLRLGFKHEELMPYITGGFAYSERTSHRISYELGYKSPYTTLGPSSALLLGWSVGCGTEFFLNDKISTKLEYLYSNFGNDVSKQSTLATGMRDNYADFANTSNNIDFHQVRVGLNYHFNSSEEKVAAKY